MAGRRGHGALALLVLTGALALAGAQVDGASAAHVARIDIRPAQVAPGGEVTVFGPPSWAPAPVTIRWNAVDGEVLGTFQTTTGGNAQWGPGTVKVPNVPPGVYDLVGTQEAPAAQTALRGVPARARVVVTGPGGAPPETVETPPVSGLKTLKEQRASMSAVVLLAIGVLVLTLGIGLGGGSVMRRRQVAA